MATYANLKIDQGSDFLTQITVEDAFGDTFDLSEYTLSGQIRKTFTSSTAYDFEIDNEFGFRGEIQIRLPASVSAAMKPGRYMYDVYGEYTEDSVANRFKLIEGIVDIIPGITRNG